MSEPVSPESVVQSAKDHLAVESNEHPVLPFKTSHLKTVEAANNEITTTFSTYATDYSGSQTTPVDENKYLKEKASVMFFVNPALDMSQLVPGRLASPPTIRAEAIKHFETWRRGWTTSIHKWFFEAVKCIVQLFGGYTAWTGLTAAQREQIFGDVFDVAPYQTALEMYGEVGNLVDVKLIYETTDAIRTPWQRFIRRCFVWLADTIYTERILLFYPTPTNLFNAALKRHKTQEQKATTTIYEKARNTIVTFNTVYGITLGACPLDDMHGLRNKKDKRKRAGGELAPNKKKKDLEHPEDLDDL